MVALMREIIILAGPNGAGKTSFAKGDFELAEAWDDNEKRIDLEKVNAALKQAARNAVTGSIADRSGKLKLPQRSTDAAQANRKPSPTTKNK